MITAVVKNSKRGKICAAYKKMCEPTRTASQATGMETEMRAASVRIPDVLRSAPPEAWRIKQQETK
jgi:hypothetical protein